MLDTLCWFRSTDLTAPPNGHTSKTSIHTTEDGRGHRSRTNKRIVSWHVLKDKRISFLLIRLVRPRTESICMEPNAFFFTQERNERLRTASFCSARSHALWRALRHTPTQRLYSADWQLHNTPRLNCGRERLHNGSTPPCNRDSGYTLQWNSNG